MEYENLRAAGQLRPSKLNALTSLRFAAAALIVIHHLHDFGLTFLKGWPLDNAVSFFFVLSGFILTYTYPDIATGSDARRFWVARFARVWPAHVATIGLLYILLAGDASRYGTGYSSPLLLLGNVSLVQAWIPVSNVYFSYNAVSWSISAEAFFYLVFPSLIQGFAKSWWWKLGIALALVFWLIALCITSSLPPFGGASWTSTTLGMVYINPLARLFEFTLGMCAAMIYRVSRPRIRLTASVGTVVEAIAALLLLLNISLVDAIASWAYVLIGPPAAEWLVHGGAICFSVAVFILVISLEQGSISKTLGRRPLVFLGEISYSMYMLHYVILRAYMMHADNFAAWPGSVKLAVYCIVLLMASWALWAFVEKPARTAILNLFATRPRTSMQPAP